MNINYSITGSGQLGREEATFTSMFVRSVEDGGNHLSASGDFTFFDNIEGVSGTAKWNAVGTYSDDDFVWSVSRKEPGQTECAFRDTETGEYVFTLIPEVNTAIKEIISSWLTRIARFIRANPGKPILANP